MTTFEPLELYGAKKEEIKDLLLTVSNADSTWSATSHFARTAFQINEIPLYVRCTFKNKRITRVILGSENGWQLHFLSRYRSAGFNEDFIPIQMYICDGEESYLDSLFLYRPWFMSPEKFMDDMTLLRIFESKWRK